MPTQIYGQQQALNWLFGGTTATAPSAQWIGLSTASPTSQFAVECTAAGYTRQSVSFGTVVTPAGSASNVNAMTFSFKAAATISGMFMIDTVSTGVGHVWLYGSIATIATCASGDTVTFAAGSIIITLF